MKKLIIAISLTSFILSTAATADPAKGQKIYMKKLKKQCKITGADFAAKHTQDEWEKLKDEGKIKDLINKECNTEIKEKYLLDLFDFFYEYANDSGNVPSC